LEAEVRRFLEVFNRIRPHEELAHERPLDVYLRSPARGPGSNENSAKTVSFSLRGTATEIVVRTAEGQDMDDSNIETAAGDGQPAADFGEAGNGLTKEQALDVSDHE